MDAVIAFTVSWLGWMSPLGTIIAWLILAGSTVDKMNSSRVIEGVLDLPRGGFEREVLRSPQPVLAVFETPWSRPCRILDRVLGEVAREAGGELKVVRVNADDDPELSIWYDVQSVPTLLYFVGGLLSARFVGTASKEAILSKLRAVSVPPADQPRPGSVPAAGEMPVGAPVHSDSETTTDSNSTFNSNSNSNPTRL